MVGSYDHGGLASIYETYSENDRVNFSEFSLDPRYRHTFWTIMIGTVIGGQANYYCTSQSFSQRMLACKDKKNMRIASYLGWCLIVFIIILAALTGMTLFKVLTVEIKNIFLTRSKDLISSNIFSIINAVIL